MEAQTLQGLAALIGATMTAVTATASMPYARRTLTLLRSKDALIRERDVRAEELAVMRATAAAWREAYDAMRADIIATQASVLQLREAHHRETLRVAMLESRLDVLAPKFMAALRYINDLQGFIAQLTGRARVAGADIDDLPCPAIPPLLNEDLAGQSG